MSSPNANGALQPSARPSRGTMLARIAISAVFAATAMAVPQFTAPETAAAASSCTGWTSQTLPPTTIKVLRTDSGKVQKVDFRRYVAEVMASGEWPSRLRKATLEAGAVATKQYAWYHAMKGHHRSAYVRGGSCYDVRDDTRDQLYRPASAKPTTKQLAAVQKTWGLSLRKRGDFFLTGYRAGTNSTCGADANGWKLYARSVEACARKGLSYKQILNKYLDPGLTLVWSAKLGPTLTKPSFKLKAGTDWDSGAASVSWRPTASSSTVASYRLQRKIGTGAWKDIALPSATARQTTAWVKIGSRSRFRVMGKDARGRVGPWVYSARRKASLRGPVGVTLSGTGIDPAYDPIKVKTRFDGRSVALMSKTGPGMGTARVFINGKRVATLDLERTKTTSRKLVWARNFAQAKPRAVAVKALDPAAQVDFEGFFILR